MRFECKLTQQEEKELCNKYLEGISTKKVGNLFNIHRMTVSNYLKKNGIELRNKRNLKEKIEEIAYLYLNENLSVGDIANKLKVTSQSVYYQLISNNIKIKDKHRKYNLNKNYFESITNHEKAYFLGFICADGCLSNKSLIITQKLSDSEILHKLKNEIKSEAPIEIIKTYDSKYNREPTTSLKLSSEKLYNDLYNLGITENKTHTIKFPNITEEFYNSFILGLFDGDGCLYVSKNQKIVEFSIVGNFDLLIKIRQIINNQFNMKGYIKKRKTGALNIVTLQYGGKPSVIKILSWLYKDSNIKLNRKYDKFQKVLKEYLENKWRKKKQYSEVMADLSRMELI